MLSTNVGNVRVYPRTDHCDFLQFHLLQLEISNFLGVPAASHAVFCNTKVNYPDMLIWSIIRGDFPLKHFGCRLKSFVAE